MSAPGALYAHHVRLDDPRWASLRGGYGIPYDPRPALARLDSKEAWGELWQELYHQGTIGEASYAAVPELVKIETRRSMPAWNTYALVATIELARDQRPSNPPVPGWLRAAYDPSISELAGLALARLPSTTDELTARSMLSVIAIWRNLRIHARLLSEYSDEEIDELIIW
jgi:hypothetical protein